MRLKVLSKLFGGTPVSKRIKKSVSFDISEELWQRQMKQFDIYGSRRKLATALFTWACDVAEADKDGEFMLRLLQNKFSPRDLVALGQDILIADDSRDPQ